MKCPTCNNDIETSGTCKHCNPKPKEKISPFANPMVALGGWLGVTVWQFLNNPILAAFVISMVTGIVVLLLYQSATKKK